MLSAFFVAGGAPLHGWTGYPPLSALPSAGPGEALGADLWVISIALFCIGALMSALNFITTTLDMRAKGMTLMRMPLTCWAWFVTAILGLLAFGVLFSAGILLLARPQRRHQLLRSARHRQRPAHRPQRRLAASCGSTCSGSSAIPRSTSRFLPAMGLCSQLLSVFSRKPIFGYKAMVYAMLSIGLLGFMVWGHHMFMSGMSPYTAFAFSDHDHGHRRSLRHQDVQLARHDLGRPHSFHFADALRHRLCFAFRLRRNQRPLPRATRARYSACTTPYFVIGHFHLIMGVASIFGIFAATYYWFPKMFGRMMNERLAQLAFLSHLRRHLRIFMPMHYAGMAGQLRRYSQFTELHYLQNLIPLQQVHDLRGLRHHRRASSSFVFNLFWSMKAGKKASDNPWEATTLEWTTATPPPHDNFGGHVPVVYNGPYEYSVPGAPTRLRDANRSPLSRPPLENPWRASPQRFRSS